MIFLFHGKDTYRSFQAAKKLLESETTVLDIPEMEPSLIFSTYASINMFLPNVTFLFKRLYRHPEHNTIFKSLSEFYESHAHIKAIRVLLWEDQKIRSTTRYYKFIQKKGKIHTFDPLTKRTFNKWAIQCCKENNLHITQNALNLLIRRTNFLPERFNNEVLKLQDLDIKEITETIIKQYTSDTFESIIWELIDSINTQQTGGNKYTARLDILERMFKQNIKPEYLIAMIARNLRQLILVRHLTDSQFKRDEICQLAHIPPFTFNQVKQKAQSMPNQHLQTLYDKLSNLDYKIKSNNIDSKLGLTLLFLAL